LAHFKKLDAFVHMPGVPFIHPASVHIFDNLFILFSVATRITALMTHHSQHQKGDE
jgi:hypothetical protein